MTSITKNYRNLRKCSDFSPLITFCPECGGKIIQDHHEEVCSECGLVINDLFLVSDSPKSDLSSHIANKIFPVNTIFIPTDAKWEKLKRINQWPLDQRRYFITPFIIVKKTLLFFDLWSESLEKQILYQLRKISQKYTITNRISLCFTLIILNLRKNGLSYNDVKKFAKLESRRYNFNCYQSDLKRYNLPVPRIGTPSEYYKQFLLEICNHEQFQKKIARYNRNTHSSYTPQQIISLISNAPKLTLRKNAKFLYGYINSRKLAAAFIYLQTKRICEIHHITSPLLSQHDIAVILHMKEQTILYYVKIVKTNLKE